MTCRRDPIMTPRAVLLALLLTLAPPALATPSLLVDAQTLEVLHAEEAGRAWHPASTTKLMTAFVVFEALRDGRVALDTEVVFSEKALSAESVKSGLAPGSVMSLEDALSAMLGVSANDAAVALAETVAGDEAAFVEMMNDAARRLQMTGTRFANPEGLFDKDQVSTARDLAILAVAVDQFFPEHLPFFGLSEVSVDGRKLPSLNALLTRYPGALGLKTGFICASGRNLVSLAARDGRRIVAVVLGATTDRERSERAAALLDAAFAGEAQGRGLQLLALPNDLGSKPEDMRAKLCGPKSSAYVRQQERIYPMGLPGRPSRLGDPSAPRTREIRTRPPAQP